MRKYYSRGDIDGLDVVVFIQNGLRDIIYTYTKINIHLDNQRLDILC